MGQGVFHDPVEFALESAIVSDSALTFLRHFFTDGLGSPLARNQAGPAMVRTMKFRRAGFAGTMRLSTLALGGRDRAGEDRALSHEGDFCS